VVIGSVKLRALKDQVDGYRMQVTLCDGAVDGAEDGFGEGTFRS
jgi:hypothetical protein